MGKMLSKNSISSFAINETIYNLKDRKNHLLLIITIIEIISILGYTYIAGGPENTFRNYLLLDRNHLWIAILYSPALFLYLFGILIGSNLLPRDIEHGYIDIFYTLPASRLDILMGKVLGGYIAISIYILLIQSIAITLTYIIFRVSITPFIITGIVLGFILAELVFYSISIYIGIKLRRRLQALATTLIILIISPILEYPIKQISLNTLPFLQQLFNILPHRPLEIPISIIYEVFHVDYMETGLINPYTGILIIIIYVVIFMILSGIEFLETDYI